MRYIANNEAREAITDPDMYTMGGTKTKIFVLEYFEYIFMP